MPKEPADPLNTRLADLPGCLHLTGCCSWIRYVPVSRMAEELGGHHLLRDVLPRLRCRHCGQRPTVIELLPSADADMPGRAGSGPAWRIDLTARA